MFSGSSAFLVHSWMDVVSNMEVVLDYLQFITVDLSIRTSVEHSNPLWGTSVVVSRWDTRREGRHREGAAEGEGGGDDEPENQEENRHASIRHASSHWLYVHGQITCERRAVGLSGPEATPERRDGGKDFLCPHLSWGCKCDPGTRLSQGWKPILFKGFEESFLWVWVKLMWQ